jgi:hypothetical protein
MHYESTGISYLEQPERRGRENDVVENLMKEHLDQYGFPLQRRNDLTDFKIEDYV